MIGPARHQRFSRAVCLWLAVSLALGPTTVAHAHEGSLTPNDGLITARVEYDALSRWTFAVGDDRQASHKSNATVYVFDELDRAIKEVAADATFRTTSYDLDSNPVSSTDANGTVVTRAFDNINRMTGVTVTPSHAWNVGCCPPY